MACTVKKSNKIRGRDAICYKRKRKSVSVMGSAYSHMLTVFEVTVFMNVVCLPHGFWRVVVPWWWWWGVSCVGFHS